MSVVCGINLQNNLMSSNIFINSWQSSFPFSLREASLMASFIFSVETMDGLLLVLNVSGFSNHSSVSLSNQVCLATQSISALQILVGALKKLRYRGVHFLVHLCLRFVHDACSMQREVSSYACSYSEESYCSVVSVPYTSLKGL